MSRPIYVTNAEDRSLRFVKARADLMEGLRLWSIWTMLGWVDVRQRYRRAIIGPFWITISMTVMVFGIGTVYGTLLKESMADFLPYLAAGFIAWLYVSTMINEGVLAFIQSEGMIKLGGTPLSVYPLRVAWRNIIIMAHNLVVMIPLYMYAGKLPILSLCWFPLGVGLVTLNLLWISFIIGALCTRFRDFPPVVTNLVQLAFFVTPVVFRAEALESRAWLVALNPLYYMVEGIRGPLIGSGIPTGVLLVLVTGAILGGVATIVFFARVRPRIAFWI